MSSRLTMNESNRTSTGVVRGSVEETLNALLDAEADRLCNAQRYERSEARRDTRAGHYERKLQTKPGEVSPRIPKLRTQASLNRKLKDSGPLLTAVTAHPTDTGHSISSCSHFGSKVTGRQT